MSGFTLHLLGRLDLRNAAGEEVRAVVRQPKRLALLGHLVLAGRGRWVRRDTLLAAFWPELDAEHARAALRRALHFLRRALGAELLPGRGEEEIGVAPEVIWCDVIAFEQALRAGDLVAALELYRGDLLPGFFVAGAPEVERWLDGERERLRRAAAGAAWTLADRVPADALQWIERAVSLAPDDEAGVHRLMLALEHRGDRLRALRAYEGFAERLRADLGVSPSQETRRLADRLRAPPTTQASGSGLASLLPSAPGPTQALLIAVCPFRVEGPERLAFLGEALMQLLSATLDGAGPVQTVEPNALRAALRRTGVATPDPAIGRRIARHFGAGRFVLGSIVEAGGRLRAVAALYDDRGAVGPRVESGAPSEEELFQLADAISRALLQHIGEATMAPLAGAAARTTTSLEALKAYLRGEQALRDGRYAAAVPEFRRATATDPAFALAHYRLAGTLAGLALIEEARAAGALAHHHRGRLSDHDSQLVEAQHTWLGGAAREAESRYAALVAAWPESLEGWFHLGDVLFHSNPDRGRDVTDARLAFERAVRLDPEHVGALTHLVRLDALEGRSDEVKRRTERLLTLSPDADHAFAIRALRAFAGGTEEQRQAVLADIGASRGFAILNAFADLAIHARNLAGAERFARTALAAARSDEFGALCRLGLACVLFGQSRRDDGLTELETVTRLVPAWGTEARAVLLCFPHDSSAPEELRRLQGGFASHPPAFAPVSPEPLQILARTRPHVAEYLAILISLRVGDRGEAAARAESLNELEVPEGCEAEVEHLVRVIEAELHAAAGRPTEALRVLEHPRRGLWHQVATWSPVFAGTHERLLRASLLLELGRAEDAGRWLDTLAQRSPFELLGLDAGRRLRRG